MTDILFNQQDSFNSYPRSADEVIADYTIVPGGFALDCITRPLQTTSEFSYPSWISHRNALGLYGGYGLEYDWAVDPSATSTSNRIDARFFNTSPAHQSPHSDGAVPCWQELLPHCPSIRDDAALAGVGGALVPFPFSDAIKIPECRPVQTPTVRSLGKPLGASRSPARSTSHRLVRHTPYPISTRRCTSPTSVYECRWSDDGATACGALVTGAKSAIWKHLQDAHAIHVRADKTVQACLWDACHKSMRRESVARHILAVHMRHKVPCPTCRTEFARTDSLQRHQRTQCLVDGKAADAGERTIALAEA